MHLLDAICGRPWLITEDGLRTILTVAAREDLDPDLARQIRDDREARPSAVTLRRAQRLEGARHAAIRDGVAIVPVTGPIVRYRDIFTEISGLTSVEALATDVQLAIESPSVRALLLTIDSPGGQVAGINELAEVLYRARATMPVWAYVDGLAASAGYWLASAAQRVVTDETALLGSIGAVLAVRDPSKVAAKDIEFVSSQSPNKRPDPTSESGRAEFQRIVDQTADVFIAAVARNRGLAADAVIAAGGQGGVLLGRAAVAAGLADALGDFEGTLTALRRVSLESEPAPALFRMTAPTYRGVATTTMEERMPDQTELEARIAALEAANQEAQERAAKAEREAAAHQQQLAAVEQRERQARAQAFAAEQLHQARIVPAQTAALTTLYAEIADRPTALTALEQVFTNAPTHRLLDEQMEASAHLTVLPATRVGAQSSDIDAARKRATQYAERVNRAGKR